MRDEKTPAMWVRVEGYTKKLQTRYNKGVQANCKAKGEKYGTKGSFVLFLFQLTIFLYFFPFSVKIASFSHLFLNTETTSFQNFNNFFLC